MKKRYKKRYVIILIILLFAVFIIMGLDDNLTVNSYELATDKLSEPLKLVLLADLHSRVYKNDQAELLDLITRQKPDLILLAGDMVDDVIPVKGAELFFSKVDDICPTYYVTGNHEYWSRNIKKIREMIQSYGVTILSDEFEEIDVNGNRLIIAGIDDPAKRKYEDSDYDQTDSMNKAFGGLSSSDAYKILLAHRPERVESYKPYGFDLAVSGHAHGGQVRIPFLINGLFAPNQGFFPKYAGGLYEHDTLTHIVSRGASNNVRWPRVFNPPEVVVIELKP